MQTAETAAPSLSNPSLFEQSKRLRLSERFSALMSFT
jgi:hypothetical protein